MFGNVYVSWFLQYGQTALHNAAYKGHVEIVSALLQAGALVNLQDKVSGVYIECLFKYFVLTGYHAAKCDQLRVFLPNKQFYVGKGDGSLSISL